MGPTVGSDPESLDHPRVRGPEPGLCCGSAAEGLRWYSPERSSPQIRRRSPAGTATPSGFGTSLPGVGYVCKNVYVYMCTYYANAFIYACFIYIYIYTCFCICVYTYVYIHLSFFVCPSLPVFQPMPTKQKTFRALDVSSKLNTRVRPVSHLHRSGCSVISGIFSEVARCGCRTNSRSKHCQHCGPIFPIHFSYHMPQMNLKMR